MIEDCGRDESVRPVHDKYSPRRMRVDPGLSTPKRPNSTPDWESMDVPDVGLDTGTGKLYFNWFPHEMGNEE